MLTKVCSNQGNGFTNYCSQFRLNILSIACKKKTNKKTKNNNNNNNKKRYAKVTMLTQLKVRRACNQCCSQGSGFKLLAKAPSKSYNA